ncbi:HEPN domain-containing protein [Sporofaciens musculi]|uniref:HEPN domain-containing protein n=1 Tax=Sporofaciens musculi TaxID=2681861 RepID=UPI0025A06574|nr:HEPN domain-containing protein [Sporofaciens musculi]
MIQSMVGNTIIDKNIYTFCYEQETEKITVYIGDKTIAIPDGIDVIIGQQLMTNGMNFYKLSSPLSNDCMTIIDKETKYVSLPSQMRAVEYFIEDYKENSKYTEMRLQFPELNYFIPSTGRVTVSEEEIAFSRIKAIVYSFDVKYCDTIVSISFDVKMNAHKKVKAIAETISEVTLKFPETDDLEYLTDLYFSVKNFFAFVCNRQNIGLRNAMLIGNYPQKVIRKGNVVNRIGSTNQKIFFSQKYLEPLENEKNVEKTPNGGLFYDKIKELFQLFFREKEEDLAIIDIGSIHSSFKYRNLIDLEQSLSITATFEYYVRTMLPEISSQDTVEFYNDIKDLVDGYIKTAKGKKKKKAKRFKNSLRPQVALEEKIIKLYEGYSNWSPLKSIFSQWFGDDISTLACAANLWRNELAHGKREYRPDEKVIDAVHLVEHINYAIVLRHAGYSDEQIKSILSDILIR